MNKRRTALIAATYLGTFMATLDISIVNVALPTIQADMHIALSGMQWIIDAYAICLAAFILAAGGLSSSYGIKRIWAIGIAGFIVSSLVCAVFGALSLLLLGRALQGVFGALIIPGALSIIFHAIEDTQVRSRIIGGWSACAALALICGPGLGGLLVDAAGWQSIFVINIPLGTIALLLGLWGIDEFFEQKNAPLDILGQLSSIICVSAMIYALIAIGENAGSVSGIVIVLFCASILLLLAFIAIEKKTKKPLIPFVLFRSAAFSVANIASFILGFSYYSSLFFLSLFFQEAQGLTASQAGSRMVPAFVFTALASFMFGRLSKQFSTQQICITGYIFLGISLCGLGFAAQETSYWALWLFLVMLGTGAGLAVPATSIIILSHAAQENMSTASAVMNALRQAGMAFGIAILGSIMNIASFSYAEGMFLRSGVADAASAARAMIMERQPIGQQALNIYREASLYGVQWAVLLAGILCLAAAVMLTVHARRS